MDVLHPELAFAPIVVLPALTEEFVNFTIAYASTVANLHVQDTAEVIGADPVTESISSGWEGVSSPHRLW